MNIDTYVRMVSVFKEKFQTGQHFHCTLAIKGGNLIAVGMNNYQAEHPRSKFGIYRKKRDDAREIYKARLHSEIDCLKQIIHRNDLHKITLLNIRINNENQVSYAEPCDNCKRVLSKFKFKRIYYTIDSQHLGRFMTTD